MSDPLKMISDLVARLTPEKREALLKRLRPPPEPIAIVGIGCRFPGGVSDPEGFWRLLHEGVDAISEVPSDRWDIDALYDPDPDAPGKMYTRWGGFLSDVGAFDARFFGISPREAASMDPQQRLLLEVAWEALENAGYAPERLAGSQTGVYLGICTNDYGQLLRAADPGALSLYTATGTCDSVAAGRLSYLLGLQGPSIALDTACSSSLVALHLAVQSLRAGECTLALAGGVNLQLAPEFTIAFSRARMMARDGRCKTFDAAADGYTRGDGCGLVVLKRLSDALQARDHIHALIRGSAVNQDGRSSGLTAPNGSAQEDVLRKALAVAEIDPGRVSYIEAHGTGTSLGDPIEMHALAAVFGAGHTPARPLRVGSVKTNIGHLEGAAGIAGLLKIVLSLQHGEIPPHLNLKQRSPYIDWTNIPVEVPVAPTPWPGGDGPRLAGVSSFGFSGTNAHVVVEEPPATVVPVIDADRPRHLLCLSAQSDAVLRALAGRYRQRLEADDKVSLADVCFTANAGRSHFSHRIAVAGESRRRMLEGLVAFLDGEPGTVQTGILEGDARPGVAFLFTGQGAQYVGMGRRLYDLEPSFRATLDRCDALLRQYLERPLLEVLFEMGPLVPGDGPLPPAPVPGAGTLHQTAYTQPALFALEVALAQLWRSWGIEPAVVLGHSAGEYAAACVAGVFSLEDGLLLVARRARLMQSLPVGGMVAVFAGESRVAELVAPLPEVSIAAVNGPAETVVAGPEPALAALTARLEALGLRWRRLKVSHAFHSAMMDPVLDQLEALAGEVRFSRPAIPLVSNLTGRLAGDEVIRTSYWRRHLREPVRFAAGVRAAHEQGARVFLEVGPGPVLGPMALRALPEREVRALASLREGRDDWESLLHALAGLYVQGAPVDWLAFDRPWPRRRVPLPTYPFERTLYRLEPSGHVTVDRISSSGTSDRSTVPAAVDRIAAPLTGAFFPALSPASEAVDMGLGMQDPTYGHALARKPERLENSANDGQYAPPLQGDGPGERSPSGTARTPFPAGSAGGQGPAEGARKRAQLAFETRLSVTQPGWLADHRIAGAPVLPATVYLEMVRRAAERAWDDSALAVRDLSIHEPLILEDTPTRLRLVLEPEPDGGRVQLFSSSLSGAEAVWTLHADGRVERVEVASGSPVSLDELRARCPGELPVADLHRDLARGGVTYGPAFHGLEQLWYGRNEALGRIRAPESLNADLETYPLHPALLDACLQVMGGTWLPYGEDAMFLPVVIGDLTLFRNAPPVLWAHAALRQGAGTDARTFDIRVFDERGEPVAEVRGLHVRRAAADMVRRPHHVGDWLYELTWRLQAAGAGAPASVPVIAGDWWVMGPETVRGPLVSMLEAAGQRVIRVSVGATFEQLGPGEVRIDKALPEDFRRLFDGGAPPKGVVFCGALEASVDDATDSGADRLVARTGEACRALLFLSQALAGLPVAPRLWVVTRGAQALPGQAEPVQPDQAALWGLGAVIARELPDLRCVRIDLDPAAPDPLETDLCASDLQIPAPRPPDLRALVDALLAETREPQLALRGGRRYAPILTPLELGAQPVNTAQLRADATYLITGGLGALGLEVARWMVARGARSLALAGRHGPQGGAADAVRALETAGIQITVFKADISDFEAVVSMLGAIGDQLPPLRGIVHAAGVLEDGALVRMDWEQFRRVLAPKVAGAWHLHLATRDLPLDFFVLFSSLAGILGTPGQGNYAAANAFLDALVHRRRTEGLPALALDWGAWTGAGMAAGMNVRQRQRLEADGFVPMSVPRGLEALERALSGQAPQVVVAPISRTRLQALFVNAPGGRTDAMPGTMPVRTEAGRGELAADLEAALPGQRYAMLLEQVSRRAVQVLQLEPGRGADPRQPLQQLGLDSLMAVELRDALARDVGRPLPASLVFDRPSLHEITRFLLGDVLGLAGAEAAPAPHPRRPAASTHEPIAIVGLACRFPGGGDSPESFWELLRNGVDAIEEVPRDRWDIDALYDPDPDAPGAMYSRWGSFLRGLDRFDARFFGVAPREADSLDPQQRLLLEVCWEALENAGQAPDRLVGSRTGVFMGMSHSDYGRLTLQSGDLQRIDAYSGTGSLNSVAIGRLSYVLGLEGPNVALDTACSSSLVAVHLAVQSLRAGESDLALAGGVNLILLPEFTVYSSRLHSLSPDGRCKAFDASANGYVRGEGCGVVVLRRLSDALAARDPILAVIRGTAMNHDGRAAGLTAPSGPAQEALLRTALADAGVAPAEITFLEAHGTGTPLGDPIEVRALGNVYSEGRSPDAPLWLGSVKSNLGHLETAAGIAGLTRAVLALQHRTIPAHLHFKQLSPHLRIDHIPARIPTEATSWAPPSGRRLAGVSSFGLSGTNAHLILEEAPAARYEEVAPEPPMPWLIPLSARTPEALRQLAQSWHNHLASQVFGLQDLAGTAALRRSHLEHRLAAVVHTREGLLEALEAFVEGQPARGMVAGHAAPDASRRLAFIFPGQGAQQVGMGQQLYRQDARFRDSMLRCDAIVRRLTGRSILDELEADEARSHLDEIDVIQPVLCAIQISIAEAWKGLGVVPDAVLGQSMGEAAAACIAGALSVEDALTVICRRSALLRRLRGRGAMAMVERSYEEALELLAGLEDRLAIGTSAGPRSVVLVGDPDALKSVTTRLEAQGIFFRPVRTDVATHCPQVEPLRDELLETLAGLRPQRGTIPYYSGVTGQILDGSALDADYFYDNMRRPVMLFQAMCRLLEDGYDTFVEVSPHPMLGPALEQTSRHLSRSSLVLPSLRRGEEERSTLLASLATLYVHGFPVDWQHVQPSGRPMRLPNYPWQRERYWIDDASLPVRGGVGRRHGGDHPLLPPPIDVAIGQDTHLWQLELHARSLPYFEDHRVRGRILVPAATYLELALAAAHKIHGPAVGSLEACDFRQALFLSEEHPVTLQLVLQASDTGVGFRIASRSAGEGDSAAPWTLHASGRIQLESPARPLEAEMIVPGSEGEPVPGAAWYDTLEGRGMEYGPVFRGVERLWQAADRAAAQVRLPEEAAAAGLKHVWHPALLDACFQVLLGAVLGPQATGNQAWLPVALERLTVWDAPAGALDVRARVRAVEGEGVVVTGDLIAVDETGRVVLEVRGLTAQRIAAAQLGVPDEISEMFHTLQWQSAGPMTGRSGALEGACLLLADAGGTAKALAARLAARGMRIVLVCPGSGFERLEDGFRIDPASGDQLERVLAEAFTDVPCRSVVHLWSLDAPEPSLTGETGASFDTAYRLGCGSLLRLVQALSRTGWRHPVRLWTVTRGAQAVLPGEPVAVSQAALWGMGRVVAHEHPELHASAIDLAPGSGADEIDRLTAELTADGSENQVALRGVTRYVARLVRAATEYLPSNANDLLKFREDSTYLITGGLRGLGLAVAAWMVDHGARHLVLVGRSVPTDEARQTIAGLEAAGAEVKLARADVTRPPALAEVLEGVKRTMPPLRGVLCSAGVLDDGILLHQTDERFRTVMAPKVEAAWNLHALTLDQPLELFVLFSSATALLGSPGQANHAAANAFEDALAHHRRAVGLPALSINWGSWAEIGYAARSAAQIALRGMTSLTPDQGLEALRRALLSERPQVAVMPLDVRQWREFYVAVADSPMLAGLAQAPRRPQQKRSGSAIKSLLVGQDPAQRQATLETHVTGQIAEVLRLDASSLDPHAPLSGLGMDSLMGLEIRNRLESDTGLTLSATLLWTYPSVAALAAYLASRLDPPVAAPVPAVAAAAATGDAPSASADAVPPSADLLTSVARVALLSDEEMEAMLLKKLESL